jgi:hypothetical protein
MARTKNQADRSGFLLYKEQWDVIDDLPNEMLGELMRSIYAYKRNGDEPPVSSPVFPYFKMYKVQFKLDDDKYDGVVGQRIKAGEESARKRAEKRATNPTHVEPVEQTQQQATNPTDKDNVKDNDITTSPLPPSSPKVEEGLRKKPRKKTKEETTVESAISHYQTEVAAARQDCDPGAEDYARLASEICGKLKTVECPNGMVKTIMRLPEQLYFAQYRKMIAKMGNHETVRSILLEMHNNYDQYLSKGRSSMYLISLDWYKNRLKKDSGPGQHGTNGGLPQPRKVHQP